MHVLRGILPFESHERAVRRQPEETVDPSRVQREPRIGDQFDVRAEQPAVDLVDEPRLARQPGAEIEALQLVEVEDAPVRQVVDEALEDGPRRGPRSVP